MMKKITTFGLLLSLFLINNSFAQFAGGSGTEEDPYQVSTIEQLQEIRNYTDKHFIQINDIDASETKEWNEGSGFLPIGDDIIPFEGNYNGDYFEIVSLYISRPGESNNAFFGTAIESIFKNVILTDFVIEGGSVRSSGLVGRITRGTISNCHVQGSMSNVSLNSGGIAGELSIGSVIKNSFAEVEISGSGQLGILVGNNLGTIENSSSIGSVISKNSYTGGLIGVNRGEVYSSYAIAYVEGDTKIGGLVGQLASDGIIENSYSISEVVGNEEVGGLVGINRDNAIIKTSYAIGKIIGTKDVGGLVGLNGASVESSYWNSDSLNNGIGRGSKGNIIGLATHQMQGDSAFYYMNDLDFENTWLLTEGYPALHWQDVESITPPDIDPPVKVNLLSPVSSSEDVPVNTEFSWNSLNAKTYQLQVSTDSEFANLSYDVENISDTTFTHDMEVLLSGSAYYWRVRAKNLIGYGDWSETWSFFTEYALDKPLAETPANEAINVEIPTRFVWLPVGEAEDYVLEVSTDEEFGELVDLNMEENANKASSRNKVNNWKITQVVNNLNFGSTYFWRVKAAGDDGNSEWSNVFSFTTESGLPNVPVWGPGNKEENVTTSPLLTWSSSQKAKTYHLQLSMSEAFEDTLLNVQDIEETEYQLDDLEGSTDYYWRVQALNDKGESGWSEVSTFKTKATTSIENPEGIPQEFTLQQNYPNPFNPTTQISYGIPKAAEVRLEVFNMLGQNVSTLVSGKKSAGWHTVTFDASGISSGFYIYRIQAGEFISTKKLMLIK